jgi:hypothetical protein
MDKNSCVFCGSKKDTYINLSSSVRDIYCKEIQHSYETIFFIICRACTKEIEKDPKLFTFKFQMGALNHENTDY